jgi:hypothetical protein
MTLFSAMWIGLVAHAGVEVIPTGPLVADAREPAVLAFHIPGAKKYKVRAEEGSVGTVIRGADDVLRVTYTPPPVESPRNLSFRVTVDGNEHTFTVLAVPAPLGRSSGTPTLPALPAWSIEARPTTLAEASKAKLSIALRTATADASPPWLIATPAIPLALKKQKDGSFLATAPVPAGTSRLSVAAGPTLPATKLPAYRAFGLPDSVGLPADGQSVAAITVWAVDRNGIPVPNVDLKLRVPDGDGAVPAVVRTEASGFARVPFRAGQQPGFTSLLMEGPAVAGEVPLLLRPPGTPEPELAGLGDPERQRWLAAWSAAIVGFVMEAPIEAPPAPKPEPAASPVPTAKPEPVNKPEAVAKAPPPEKERPTPTTEPVKPAPAAPPVPAEAPVANAAPAPPPKAVSQARLRAFGAAAHTRGRYQLTVDDPSLAAAEFRAPALGFWGIDAGADLRLLSASWGALFTEVRASASLPGLRLPDGPRVTVLHAISANLAWRRSLSGAFAAQVAGGLDHHAALFFRYTDPTRLEATPSPEGVLGGRLSGALLRETERLLVRAEVAEVFAPAPVLTQIGGRAEFPLAGGWIVYTAARADVHHLGAVASESGASGSFVQPVFSGGVAIVR